MNYEGRKTEQKWQKIWEEKSLYTTDLNDKKKEKFYALVMFPYPSGDKLHIGHWYNFAPADSYARYMRMKGFNVLEPMGYDSFGLPAENYAIKHGVHPKKSIPQNIASMTRQLKEMGAMYDWEKTVVTSDPTYYKWTQWMFLQLYKNGLAYKKNAPVNWCPSCQTVLANEQVEEGLCERCDSEVIQKNLTQWFFNIKKYAERLLDFGGLDWPEKTKLMQQNWIGRSEGVTFHQKVKDMDIEFDSYDSVPQTFTAQTFAVIAPEHPMLKKLVEGTKYEKSVMEFATKMKHKKMANKFNIDKDMEGIFTGRYVDNPFGTGDLPIWAASFVLYEYGSGVVNCSVHDERDFEFAKKYGIPLRPVMLPPDEKFALKVKNLEVCYHHAPEGILQDPPEFKGRKWDEVRDDVIAYIERKGFGKRTVNYKLRDWLISRQRYWGAPIPIVYCAKCARLRQGFGGQGEWPVPEEDLPVELPDNVDFEPKGDGKSPLATSPDFVNTKCPKCGGKATREVDTMDTFMCSSWYFLRYVDNKNDKKPFDAKMLKKWLPVDLYVGGPEHACMHLLYARFLIKALYDAKLVHFDEPFTRLVHQGMITKDGAKMSKSKGNVVSPDTFVEQYGSDVFRMYLMFMGPFTEGGDWNDRGITGIVRFVERMWNLMLTPHVEKDSDELLHQLHLAVQKLTSDIETFHFNTAIATLMELLNSAGKEGISLKSKKLLAQIIAPLAPHLAEEIWEKLGEEFSIFNSDWPKPDKKYLAAQTFELVMQVNGKVRARITAKIGISKEEAIELALKQPGVDAHLKGKKRIKEIFVPDRLLNMVVTD